MTELAAVIVGLLAVCVGAFFAAMEHRKDVRRKNMFAQLRIELQIARRSIEKSKEILADEEFSQHLEQAGNSLSYAEETLDILEEGK